MLQRLSRCFRLRDAPSQSIRAVLHERMSCRSELRFLTEPSSLSSIGGNFGTFLRGALHAAGHLARHRALLLDRDQADGASVMREEATLPRALALDAQRCRRARRLQD